MGCILFILSEFFHSFIFCILKENTNRYRKRQSIRSNVHDNFTTTYAVLRLTILIFSIHFSSLLLTEWQIALQSLWLWQKYQIHALWLLLSQILSKTVIPGTFSSGSMFKLTSDQLTQLYLVALSFVWKFKAHHSTGCNYGIPDLLFLNQGVIYKNLIFTLNHLNSKVAINTVCMVSFSIASTAMYTGFSNIPFSGIPPYTL